MISFFNSLVVISQGLLQQVLEGLSVMVTNMLFPTHYLVLLGACHLRGVVLASAVGKKVQSCRLAFQ